MLYRDLGLQLAAESFSDLPANPVLTILGLNKYVNAHDEEEQGQDKPFYYFFKSPQRQLFKVQN